MLFKLRAGEASAARRGGSEVGSSASGMARWVCVSPGLPLPGGGLSLGAGPTLPCSRESRGPGSNPEPAHIQHILAKLLNLSFLVAKRLAHVPGVVVMAVGPAGLVWARAGRGGLWSEWGGFQRTRGPARGDTHGAPSQP